MMQPTILFEDNHLIVVNKPAGMPSQDDPTGDRSAYAWTMQYIKEKYEKPGAVYLALLHRLDRPVSGVLALAKTGKAAKRLSKDWQSRNIQKTYWALVHKHPPAEQGTLRHYIRKLPNKNIVRAEKDESRGGKLGVLHYQVLQRFEDLSALVQVHLETGRRHQIRVQLAAIGSVIIGDVKYGKSDFLEDKSIALLARQLTLTHPTLKQKMTFTAPLPELSLWQQARVE